MALGYRNPSSYAASQQSVPAKREGQRGVVLEESAAWLPWDIVKSFSFVLEQQLQNQSTSCVGTVAFCEHYCARQSEALSEMLSTSLQPIDITLPTIILRISLKLNLEVWFVLEKMTF